MIHPLSDVKSRKIGTTSNIWQFVVVCDGAEIGEGCNICSHCFIEAGAKVGNNVTVKCGVQLWDGITLENNVFVGPGVVFTNDKNPQSKNKHFTLEKTVVREGASIGGGSVILPGIVIGKNAIVGAGSVVTRDVPENTTVYGQSAVERQVRNG